MIIAEPGDSAVGLGDRLHNGEAQTAAPPGARGRGEADERMGQIVVGEARTMITNLYLNGVAGALPISSTFPAPCVSALSTRLLKAYSRRGRSAKIIPSSD